MYIIPPADDELEDDAGDDDADDDETTQLAPKRPQAKQAKRPQPKPKRNGRRRR
jgi:hypothetical protein